MTAIDAEWVYAHAVIGGGAAAVAMLLALQARGAASGSSVWIAPAGECGVGIAYGAVDPAHLLNVPARRMSVLADQDLDFCEFLDQRRGAADPQRYYPRCVYGEYLQARLQRSDAHWQRVVAQAHSLDRCAEGYRIHLDGGRSVLARTVVIAAGPPSPRCLPGVAAELLASGRYVIDIWQWIATLRSQPPVQSAWIIGSGLSAVDLALSLAAAHPEARIDMLSRHGQLPGVHQTPAADPWDADGALADGLLEEPGLWRRWLRFRRELDAAADWRVVVDSLRALSTRLWRSLSLADQARFLRHLRCWFDNARHRMAPEIAQRLSQLQNSGQLRLHAGRLLRARPDATGRAQLLWRDRGAREPRYADTDLVLQACGMELGVDPNGASLYSELVRAGLAQRHPLGLGLQTDTTLRLLGADGHADGKLYLLGAMARGSLWECGAMPEIRVHARTIAQQLLPD